MGWVRASAVDVCPKDGPLLWLQLMSDHWERLGWDFLVVDTLESLSPSLGTVYFLCSSCVVLRVCFWEMRWVRLNQACVPVKRRWLSECLLHLSERTLIEGGQDQRRVMLAPGPVCAHLSQGVCCSS